jgi:hypothetical protein
VGTAERGMGCEPVSVAALRHPDAPRAQSADRPRAHVIPQTIEEVYAEAGLPDLRCPFGKPA